MIDEILERLGLDEKELSQAEQDSLSSMYNDLQKSQVTVESIRESIASMKNAVENELSVHDVNDSHDVFLKARLRNYLLLESFISTPEKAKRLLESRLASLVPNIKK